MADGGAVQWGIDGIVAVVLTVGGGIVNALRGDHKELENKHDRLSEALPQTYARRDDVKEAFDELKTQHRIINEKLDRLISRG